jgi:hypothetical protein
MIRDLFTPPAIVRSAEDSIDSRIDANLSRSRRNEEEAIAIAREWDAIRTACKSKCISFDSALRKRGANPSTVYRSLDLLKPATVEVENSPKWENFTPEESLDYEQPSLLSEDAPSFSAPSVSTTEPEEPGPSAKTPHVGRATGDYEWYTKPAYIEAARRVLGGIDLDPASCDLAQQTVKATAFYT